MVQFKNAFLGQETLDYVRATTSQTCLRVSGKHYDLENVGRTTHHHTFFEMLGNFSFGDYFKREAIEWGWELTTEVFGIDPEKLVITIFREDDEADRLWREGIGLPAEKVIRLDEDENFWSMGDTGPCGPCSEIHYDFGVNAACKSAVCDPSCACGRWGEIWNLVFMQFERDASGNQTPLPKPSIDTGAGLARVARVIQGVPTTFDTDLFRGIMDRIQEISEVKRGEDSENDVSMNVIADHARALVFLIGDGVLPGNEGRSYVLRRLLRRAARHGVLLGVERPFLFRVADTVIDEMSGAYPELRDRSAYITNLIQREEERFLLTLANGLSLLEEHIAGLEERGEKVLSGGSVFKLYDTFGFPVDLTADILRSARAKWEGSGDERVAAIYGELASELSTVFRGHEELTGASTIRALLVGGERREVARSGEKVEVIVGETPFYAESGGQVGDCGTLRSPDGEIEITDTQRPSGQLVVHRGVVTKGEVHVDSRVELAVDGGARAATVDPFRIRDCLGCATYRGTHGCRGVGVFPQSGKDPPKNFGTAARTERQTARAGRETAGGQAQSGARDRAVAIESARRDFERSHPKRQGGRGGASGDISSGGRGSRGASGHGGRPARETRERDRAAGSRDRRPGLSRARRHKGSDRPVSSG
jgi:alanyl-tRNA synthetase